MNHKYIPGKDIAEKINQQTKAIVQGFNPKPRLAIVLASNDESSHKYVEEMKMKKAESLGIETKLYYYDENITFENLLFETKKFRHNEAVSGVLLQLPLYDHLKNFTPELVNAITSEKDADGLTAIQQGNASHMLSNSILPAAVEAVLECLNYCYDEEDLTWDSIQKDYSKLESYRGKNVLIVNNTNLVGKPLAQILSTLGATVTIANIFTPNLEDLCKISDIVISATNQTNLFDDSYIKEDAILIDVTSVSDNGKVYGDFIQTPELLEKVAYITPVPGGVGPLTIACLMRNLVRLVNQ